MLIFLYVSNFDPIYHSKNYFDFVKNKYGRAGELTFNKITDSIIYRKMHRLILQIIAGIIGFWLAFKIVPGVEINIIPNISGIFGIQFTAVWQILILIGSVLGLINFFVKPILKAISLPLRILTLGLFSLIINMVIVWIVDVLFPELLIPGLIPLFWTTVIIWLTSLLLGIYRPKQKIVTAE